MDDIAVDCDFEAALGGLWQHIITFASIFWELLSLTLTIYKFRLLELVSKKGLNKILQGGCSVLCYGSMEAQTSK